MMPIRRASLLALLLPLFLAGCAEKFTRQNFNLLQVGVDERYDVDKLLGHPTNDLHDQWYYEHRDKHYSALIHFDPDGKVSGKQWFDSPTASISGDNPNADQPPKGKVREEKRKSRIIE